MCKCVKSAEKGNCCCNERTTTEAVLFKLHTYL
jgi:hypothetical protein